MKSFNQHINEDQEKLEEDLTDLVKLAVVGGGLLAAKGAWDKWGKGSWLANKLAITKTQKAKVAQDKLDKIDRKKKEKETIAKAAGLDKDKDKEGNFTNQKDAQAYKDETGEAPDGWVTSPEKSPGKGEVWTTKDQEKWDADAEKRAETKKKRGARDKEKTKAGQDVTKKKLTDLTPAEKKKRLALAKKKRADREAGKEEFQRFALQELFIDLTENSRTQLLEELVLEETMSLEESQELQAIMALDDAGIKADINRKGQVVIKKKDKKKAHIALEKSFKKGGWPPLKLEDVDEHKGTEPHKHPHEDEELDEASSKKARNKAADEIEKIADKGGAEAPTLFSLASKLRKGTHSTTGLKLSKQVTSILKDNGIKEEVDLNTYQEMKMSMAAKKKRALWAKTAAGKKSAKKSKIRAKKVRAGSIKIDKAKGRKMAMARKKGGIRDAYEIVSEARNRAKENKPEWETEDSRLS